MGRGLSKLQRYILAEAVTGHRTHYCKILAGFFGWETAWASPARRSPTPGCRNFDPNEIGRKRYRSAVAALSRACRRLEARGLVTCLQGAYSHWSAVEITDKGREWLLVNSVADRPSS
jgi:hypothetical protein